MINDVVYDPLLFFYLDDSGSLVGEQRYLPFGEARTDLPGITATDLSFTGQRALEGTGLIDYKARQYDPALRSFIQADSIIPNPYGVLDYNRYLYVHANPVRFTDPSGNRPCGDGEAVDCNGMKPHSPVIDNSSNEPDPLPPDQGNQSCKGENKSVLCMDPTLISTGSVRTSDVYPIYQTSVTYDGPYIDESCIVPWVCIFLLLADGISYVQYRSEIPSRLSEQFVYAKVNYEEHVGNYQNVYLITDISIFNRTNDVIRLDNLRLDDNPMLKPSQMIAILPNQVATIQLNRTIFSHLRISTASEQFNQVYLDVKIP